MNSPAPREMPGYPVMFDTFGLPERFWIQIDLGRECWEWSGHKDGLGYGLIRLRRPDGSSRMVRTHRAMYEAVVGPIAPGLELDHLCRNPSCLRPAHLEAVSHGENMRRSKAPPGLHFRKTHCVRGHPLSGENLSVRPCDGARICRTCRNANNRRTYAAREARR